MSKKFKIDLPGSEHVGQNAVEVKLFKSPLGHSRMADLKISSDGMSVKIYMMESDLRLLAHEILQITDPKLD